ncbi:hypothetical protein GJ496_011107, partial [Pomphorhynchus laevis]
TARKYTIKFTNLSISYISGIVKVH